MTTHAALEWRDGLPYSTEFDDTYFSVSPDNPQHGLAETRHVFLQHNQLQQRWQNLPIDKPSHFVIVETGFGSGLNFLASLKLWREVAPQSAHLHFVSIEIAPFSLHDLQQAHAHFPELAEASLALCKQYRFLQPGINQLELSDFSTSLTLHIADAASVLPGLDLKADAWFLDGFAPSKNPDMWQAPLFQCMSRCAKAGTTFATFTCAGFVRRQLKETGFNVNKTAGYGLKREMLSGEWPVAENTIPTTLPRVAVIGAGIAGCSTAWFLASMGCKVHVFERAEAIASGASGNPRGMLYPRLNTEELLNDELALRSYSFSLRHFANLRLGEDAFKHNGLLQLGGAAREQKRVHKVAARYAHLGLVQQVDATEATELAGVTLTSDCLYFADAAWVNPHEACIAMLKHVNIQVHLQQNIIALSKQDDWQLQSNAGSHEGFDAVIVANAADAGELLPDSSMWLNPVRGQMGMIAGQTAMRDLKMILCGIGYLTPLQDGMHAMGATFAHGDLDTRVREEDNASNLNMISNLSPQFNEASSADITYARASMRCGSPDYLPYVGPLLPTDKLTPTAISITDFEDLPPPQGLYIHVAHGSKGLMTAPYCAAVMARRLLKDFSIALPQLTEDSFWNGLHPQRLLFKQLGWKKLLKPFKVAV
ncbi:MAG TPA: bifunctional tRNA (5-methylaminomethyl-2-thiouridine)(34)-methyltransferase MnmD/FAD-dependent 5-carboxymethylaminomethyl-2-thiouridine(34) oxidoreductase MnmC [Methylophilus sp.]|uniref:bifunctional tRNA (5-methylaminomethyl-2-thiouridine)(34)-methyltransferase MnmD/FAD-dependent 5-carboxymethylaminomethyl-2-thiouridine(34) oxidoreductase MnmC n=1 Tax=Methylophilus sp. TaxID=29541 RepID=UPI002C98B304|nr:bifunctional tRNA (5-methylaminomethyl-2-thiouridine)(34)-methyltransferase MnmD/FAD-dependent 5-carboxymethylaminomethyl-2-thiouridine(34) oxidoreductase MnmC [Methylophilus sp.]HSH88058.1 bifunctional tRNA (5-methylaminomethyl-2-thiouridine)(34)-methyltransferase MnmD/FAD-dependent 5-carboxymethylaminomethyl-2-thiouridine(34) oxidoreductase MnmC [Methylophilus sp.]